MKQLPKPDYTNPRGIPRAPFIDSVDEYAESSEDATALLAQLQETLQKYQFMEQATQSRVRALLDKIPDISKSLEIARFLKTRDEPVDTRYELNETVYAEAEVPPTDKVFLWLGANVMLEYPVDEAVELLETRLTGANESLDACRADLEFLRENMTTVEVTSARVINWRVDKRRQEGAKA